MATLTTKIVITWQTLEDRRNVNLIAPSQQTLNRQIALGQTDGAYYPISSLVTQRNYIDEASANEYGNVLLTATAAFGVTPPTIAVSPI